MGNDYMYPACRDFCSHVQNHQLPADIYEQPPYQSENWSIWGQDMTTFCEIIGESDDGSCTVKISFGCDLCAQNGNYDTSDGDRCASHVQTHVFDAQGLKTQSQWCNTFYADTILTETSTLCLDRSYSYEVSSNSSAVPKQMEILAETFSVHTETDIHICESIEIDATLCATRTLQDCSNVPMLGGEGTTFSSCTGEHFGGLVSTFYKINLDPNDNYPGSCYDDEHPSQASEEGQSGEDLRAIGVAALIAVIVFSVGVVMVVFILIGCCLVLCGRSSSGQSRSGATYSTNEPTYQVQQYQQQPIPTAPVAMVISVEDPQPFAKVADDAPTPIAMPLSEVDLHQSNIANVTMY